MDSLFIFHTIFYIFITNLLLHISLLHTAREAYIIHLFILSLYISHISFSLFFFYHPKMISRSIFPSYPDIILLHMHTTSYKNIYSLFYILLYHTQIIIFSILIIKLCILFTYTPLKENSKTNKQICHTAKRMMRTNLHSAIHT